MCWDGERAGRAGGCIFIEGIIAILFRSVRRYGYYVQLLQIMVPLCGTLTLSRALSDGGYMYGGAHAACCARPFIMVIDK